MQMCRSVLALPGIVEAPSTGDREGLAVFRKEASPAKGGEDVLKM